MGTLDYVFVGCDNPVKESWLKERTPFSYLFFSPQNPPSIFTSNPFKPRPPMSEENKTDNPYQPPTLSDEPLVNQEVARPKATLTPVHVLLPALAYAYLPAAIVLSTGEGKEIEIPLPYGLGPVFECDLGRFAVFFLTLPVSLPLYAAALFFLNLRRNRHGTNTLGLKFYNALSLIPLICGCALGLKVAIEVFG